MKLTTTQLRVIETHCNIDAQTAIDAGSLVFFPTDFLFTCFPYSKPKTNTYTHIIGQRSLTLNADPEFGVPYGSIARLLLAKITAEACKTKSRIQQLPRISQFLKELDTAVTGNRILSIRNQALSLFTTQILLKNQSLNRIKGKNFTLIEDYSVWSTRTKTQTDWVSEIKLSEAFYIQATESALPVDYRALRQLARSPIAMDIFMWLTYRLNVVKNDTLITWENLKSQFGQNYLDDKHGRYNFKRKFKELLLLACTLYSEANIELTEQGLILRKSKPHVAK